MHNNMIWYLLYTLRKQESLYICKFILKLFVLNFLYRLNCLNGDFRTYPVVSRDTQCLNSYCILLNPKFSKFLTFNLLDVGVCMLHSSVHVGSVDCGNRSSNTWPSRVDVLMQSRGPDYTMKLEQEQASSCWLPGIQPGGQVCQG